MKRVSQNPNGYVWTLVVTMIALLSFAVKAGAQVVPFDPDLYGELAGKWWQYSIGIPGNYDSEAHPSINNQPDPTGQFCHVAQSDAPIFYLSGGGLGLQRSCTVPHNKMLFFPIVNSECSSLELDPFFCDDEVSCLQCTMSHQCPEKDVAMAEIDGEPVVNGEGSTNLAQDYYAVSGLFPIKIVANNILYSPARPGSMGISTASGYWLLLEPLSRGQHTIHFYGKQYDNCGDDGFEQDVTYSLTVK